MSSLPAGRVRAGGRLLVNPVLSWGDPEGSAIGFAAVSDAGNFDGVLVFEVEKDPVIAAAEAEAGAWRLEFLYVPVPDGKVAV